MKFINKIVLFVVLAMTALSGCKTNNIVSSKPQIYTSFYALYDFTKAIVGDCADVYNIVPVGTEPHDWEPTVQDMAKINSADVLFYNGLGMESWIDKVQSSVENDVVFTEVSKGVEVSSENIDPHIWLDPVNVKSMCKNILDTLILVDPSNSEIYEANYNNYMVALDSLDQSYKASLEGVQNKNIVVSHEAYSYLCNAYGLTQTAIDGMSADSEPSPDKMKQLIDFVKNNNIKYIFCEELVSKKAAQTLADETGAQILELNPFEGLTSDEIASGETYITIMQKNLENIMTSLNN